jgi:hypothetical protein
VDVVDTEITTRMEEAEVEGVALINRGISKGGEEVEVGDPRRLLLDEGEDVVAITIAAWMTSEAKCNRAMPQESHMKTSHHCLPHIKGSKQRDRERSRASMTIAVCHPGHRVRGEGVEEAWDSITKWHVYCTVLYGIFALL